MKNSWNESNERKPLKRRASVLDQKNSDSEQNDNLDQIDQKERGFYKER